MIHIYSNFEVADNTGVIKVFGIRNLSKKSMFCTLGDIIVGVVKFAKANSKYKISTIVKGIIIRSKVFTKNENIKIKFSNNSIVLVDNKSNLLGTRIYGDIPKVVLNKYKKLSSITNNII